MLAAKVRVRVAERAGAVLTRDNLAGLARGRRRHGIAWLPDLDSGIDVKRRTRGRRICRGNDHRERVRRVADDAVICPRVRSQEARTGLSSCTD